MKLLLTLPHFILENPWRFGIIIASIILLWVILHFIKKHNEYNYIECTGYYSRGDEKNLQVKSRFRNHVTVRIHKKEKTYEYHSSNGRWIILRRVQINQIESKMEFDFPKKDSQHVHA